MSQVPPARPLASIVPGKRTLVCAALASTYNAALRVATTARGREPLLDIRIGDVIFKVVLDHSSSENLVGTRAMDATHAVGAKHKS